MSEELQDRDECMSWEDAYKIAYDTAQRSVEDMRKILKEFAEDDPYETGDPNWAEDPDMMSAAVEPMAMTLMHILNRRGLIRIDP